MISYESYIFIVTIMLFVVGGLSGITTVLAWKLKQNTDAVASCIRFVFCILLAVLFVTMN